jgi:hypothetical protein
MSYALSAALQKGVFEVLSADATVTAAVGDAIYDASPSGAVPDLFLSIGAERVEARMDVSGWIAVHRFTVSVVAQDTGGFARAKAAAGAVSDALDGEPPVLERGRVLSITFERADARRVSSGGRRRIDLRFAARVEDQ